VTAAANFAQAAISSGRFEPVELVQWQACLILIHNERPDCDSPTPRNHGSAAVGAAMILLALPSRRSSARSVAVDKPLLRPFKILTVNSLPSGPELS
jgi:hypothetical protein